MTDQGGSSVAHTYFGSTLNDVHVASTIISNFRVIPLPCLTAPTVLILYK